MSATPIESWFVHTLIVVTFAALAALAVSRATRRARATSRHAVLATALVVVVVAPVLLASWSLLAMPRIAIPVPRGWLAPPSELAADVAGSAPRAAPRRPTAVSGRIVGDAPNEAVAARATSPWVLVVLATWLAGALRAALVAGRGAAWLSRALARLAPLADPRFAPAAARAARRLGLARVPVVAASAAIPVPVSLGLVRPRIAIPVGLEHTLADLDVESVVLHETAHIAHRHHWWAALALVARVLWWWHPPVLALTRRVGEVHEEVSDNEVLASRRDATGYARCLVAIAEQLITPPTPLPGAIALLRADSGFERRIRHIVDKERDVMNRFALRHAFAVVCFLGLAVSLALVAPVQAADDPPPPAPPAPKPVDPPKPGDPPKPVEPTWQEALAKKLAELKVTVDFVDTPLADMCAFATQLTGVTIAIDPRTDLAAKTSSLRLKDATLKAMLDFLAEAYDAAHVSRCGVVVITTKRLAATIPADAPAAPEARRAACKKLIAVNFAEAPVSDVIGFVRELIGIDIAIGPGVDATRGVTLEASRVRALQVLTLVAEFADADVTWVENGVVIKARAKPEPVRR